MKILQLSQNDYGTGAAKAAYRLHKSLIDLNVCSEMFTNHKLTNDTHVHGPNAGRPTIISRYRRRLAHELLRFQRSPHRILHSMNIFPSTTLRSINPWDGDIVNLHWINDEMISIPEIARINKPIVWTLHDSWAFCGAEHHPSPYHAKRYIEGYTKSNRPSNESGLDLDRWVWCQKVKHWQTRPFHIVTPSRWLGACARSSILFRNKSTRIIPNGIDINLYAPQEKSFSCHSLHLPADRTFVSAHLPSVIDSDYKGYKLLSAVFQSLNYIKKDTEYIFFGGGQYNIKNINKYKIHNIGFLNQDQDLMHLYSASDVLVVPSKIENLPNIVLESLSCGTPVVAFKVGGLPDLIDHQKNGYLAKPFDTVDFVRGILWVIENEERLKELRRNARKKIVQEFAAPLIAKRYLELYMEVLEQEGKRR